MHYSISLNVTAMLRMVRGDSTPGSCLPAKDQAHDYVALSNNEEVAARIAMQIVTSVQQLAVYPMSGKAGRVTGTRELVISNTPFIVAYGIEKADIVALAVYHSAQHWPEGF